MAFFKKQTKPPEKNKKRLLPNGKLICENDGLDLLYPDGGGEPLRGRIVPMDGGGQTFHEDTIPDGDDGGD